MDRILPDIISYSIGAILMTGIAIYLKRTQTPDKTFFGFSLSTAIKIIYIGVFCFVMLIIATLIKGEPV